MQERATKLSDLRWGLGETRVAARLDRWDRWLGASYARLMRRRVVRIVGSVLALLLLLLLVVGKWQALTRLLTAHQAAGDLSTWAVALNDGLQMLFLVLLALLVVVRRTVRTGTARLSGILAALGGTLAPLLLIAESNQGLQAPLASLTALLLLAGMGWSLWSLAMLGRCFSVLPEVRGLVTRGPYHWVRHPVYLGEITATLGVLLPILSLRNGAFFALFCALQLWRTRNEETALASTFPEYADYRRHTARLIPGLW